jgi:TM2 domain-containing membrane protein YozV
VKLSLQILSLFDTMVKIIHWRMKKMFCRNCGNEMANNAAVCVKCGVAAGVGTSYCQNCGQPTMPGAAACTNCGVFLTQPIPAGSQKSKLAAGLLGIFLGGLGIHNFYLGKTNRALIQLIVCLVGGALTCGIASAGMEIWGLVEGIMILTGNIAVDGHGIPLKD